jgi:hypothetical protein
MRLPVSHPRLLREYVRVRLEITQLVSSPAEFDAATVRSNQIQMHTGLIQTPNEMVDDHLTRMAALRARVPNTL